MDPEQKITRPRQLYVGQGVRDLEDDVSRAQR
jgi:citrate synthase